MKENNDNIEGQLEAAEELQSAGRRSLLRGTATALPAILTLHSGAALARSSNLISTTEFESTDRRGRTLCLDLDTVRPVGRRGYKYDIGENGHADVYRIPEGNYFVRRRNGSWRPIDESALCERGGIAVHKVNGKLQKVEVPIRRGRGGMISLTAATSMAENIIVHDI